MLFVLGNSFIALGESTSWTQAFGPIVASVVAGLYADAFLARMPRLLDDRRAYGAFAFTVPVVYHGVYLAYVATVLGGTWWNPAYSAGVLFYCGIFSLLFALVAFPERARS